MLLISIPTLYLLIACLQALSVVGIMKTPNSFLSFLTFVVLSGHALLLYQWVETAQGQNLDPYLMLSLTLWLMGVIIFLSFNSVFNPLRALIYPLAAGSLILYHFTGGSFVLETSAHPEMLVHILISLLSVSILLLATSQALIVYVQHTLLKKHLPHPMLTVLPPLQQMERLLFIILGLSFILLSLTLISGFASFSEHFETTLPKMFLATCAWALCGLMVWARLFRGLRGYSACKLSLLAGCLLFGSYFGTKLILL